MIPIELTDTELDAVSGGFSINFSDIDQKNIVRQSGYAVNVLTLGSLANVTQAAVQSNSIG
jgi:bacteriocin-like protein